MKNVCDTIPCPPLLQMIDRLADTQPTQTINNEEKLTFSIAVVESFSPPKTVSLPLVYCPFCGTRIEEDWPIAFSTGKPIRTRRSDDD